MSEKTTDAELAEVARLDALATPGPWEERGGVIVWPGDDVERGAVVGEIGLDDAALTVLLRTVGPSLAAEVTALRAERLAAVAWLRARAKATEDEIDDDTDGVDADAFCEEADVLRRAADGMEQWIEAGCPQVTT